jgi:hypothetical protein
MFMNGVHRIFIINVLHDVRIFPAEYFHLSLFLKGRSAPNLS